jgi:hypothetical protein
MKTAIAALALVAGMATTQAAMAACDQTSGNATWDVYDSAVRCNGTVLNGVTSLICTDYNGYQSTIKGTLTIAPCCRVKGTLTQVYANGLTYYITLTQVTMDLSHNVMAGVSQIAGSQGFYNFQAIRR